MSYVCVLAVALCLVCELVIWCLVVFPIQYSIARYDTGTDLLKVYLDPCRCVPKWYSRRFRVKVCQTPGPARSGRPQQPALAGLLRSRRQLACGLGGTMRRVEVVDKHPRTVLRVSYCGGLCIGGVQEWCIRSSLSLLWHGRWIVFVHVQSAHRFMASMSHVDTSQRRRPAPNNG